MRVLFETKDITGFNMFDPVARVLKSLGHEVTIVAEPEGIAADAWLKAGWSIYGPQPNISAEAILKVMSPDVVVVELAGNMTDFGKSFALAANKLGKPLGFVEDLWHAHRRCPEAPPDFICTLDAYGERVIGEYSEYKGLPRPGDRHPVDSYNHKPKVFITGSPAMDVLKDVVADPGIEEVIRQSNPKRVILIAGQGASTSAMMRGLAQALGREKGCLILPRCHPGLMKHPSWQEASKEWVEIADGMSGNHQVIWTNPAVSTRSLIRVSTEVHSIFSGALSEGATLGALPVSWMTEEGKAEMQASLKIEGMNHFPLSELGAAIEVTNPDEYREKVASLSGSDRNAFVTEAQKILSFDFGATERVVQAILESCRR
jgi:hypothetical protein